MRSLGFIVSVDSYLVRRGVVSMLHQIPGVRVIREFESAPELKSYLKNHTIDFLILGVSMMDSDMDLILSESGHYENTILLKRVWEESDKNEVRTILYFTDSREEIFQKVRGFILRNGGLKGKEESQVLTQREETIVRLVSMGLTNKQIADKLFLSTHTVTTHRKNIISKLGIKSVSGLTIYAIVNNIITIDEVDSKPSQ